METDVELSLEPIVEYNMTSQQAKAYKICLMWVVLSRKIFPNYQHTRWKSGDPRKSNLFKYAFKLVRETEGLLPDDEYKLYVKAQLDIMKAINPMGMIEPFLIAGPKSWIRFKIWKRKYDAINKRQTMEDVSLDVISQDQIIKELNQTHKFLLSMALNELTPEWIRCSHKDIERWVALGKISPFYALLSPLVKKYCNITNLDLELYRPSIGPESEIVFKELFSYEL